MGKRREPRKEIKVPVRIFGTDSSGQIFSEKVFTVNVSRHGAELSGVRAQPNLDEIIGLTYGATKAHFRVKWVGQPGTPKLGHLGLLNLSPEKTLWDFPLPGAAVDGSARDAHDRRAHPRVRCGNSVEVHLPNQDAPIRARIGDISEGGCFVEMPNPLAPTTEIRLAFWVKETKLSANGKVITSTPGYGNGVQFTGMSGQDKALLKQFVSSLIRIPK
ncbi:MAG TPA: PilZ domain-containing protein [Terriglobales bacterium]|nr:PilZ domain-containing protein [Terriglobales bacterium]